MGRIALIVLAILAIGSAQLAAQERNGRDDKEREAAKHFREANELFGSKDYLKAVERYRDAIKLAPHLPLPYFNAGIAAFLGGKPKIAVEMWSKVKKIVPLDWRTRAKLVQAYQATGDVKARNRERSELLKLRAGGKNADLSRSPRYCREQLVFKAYRIFVYEYFDLVGEQAIRYSFRLVGKGGKMFDYKFSLGSYAKTNALARESGKLKAGKRLFHLDGYSSSGHDTWEFFTGEPGYDKVREAVMRILKGKRSPLSKPGKEARPK